MLGGDVTCRVEGPVMTVTFNRPDRLNAVTFEMVDRYFDLLDRADVDPSVRVIVVTGAGRAFCAGMDASSLSVSANGVRRQVSGGRLMTHAMSLHKPVIAAVNGACAGLGFVFAISCDLRFAAESALFTTSFTRRGLNAEYGSSWLLPRIVGHTRAMDLLLSARRFGASEADRMGLVNAVAPDAELAGQVAEYANELATQCSPIAMADTKRQVFEDWDSRLDASLSRAKVLGHSPGHRKDFAEGVAALRERRSPAFADLEPTDFDGIE